MDEMLSSSEGRGVHIPVMSDEVMELLKVRRGGIYIDGTLGSGGHTRLMLERVGADGMVMAIDRDVDALERTKSLQAEFGARFCAVHGNYSDMEALAHSRGIARVDGVLLDLGVSSDQIDTAERGFSFMHDGPLDMRMDRSREYTAADVVNGASLDELTRILREYGEERSARRVAVAIVERRQEHSFVTTADLAGVIEQAKGGRRGRIHPATKSFQALRMEVNAELAGVSAGLRGGLELVRDGGRMAVISFHSLEDRIVKRFFAAHEGRWESLAAGGERWEGELPAVKRVTRKPVQAGVEELDSNPRSRSAKLRVVERLAEPYRKGRIGYGT
jgi:16S rRNA (cytosine1402-N4)-methyltransferase